MLDSPKCTVGIGEIWVQFQRFVGCRFGFSIKLSIRANGKTCLPEVGIRQTRESQSIIRVEIYRLLKFVDRFFGISFLQKKAPPPINLKSSAVLCVVPGEKFSFFRIESRTK